MLCIVSNTAYRLWCFGCLLWWKLLTIDPAAIRLNISLLVKHSTKTIHHHYHHNFSKTYVKKWRTATKVNTPILPSYETSEWNWQSVLRSTIASSNWFEFTNQYSATAFIAKRLKPSFVFHGCLSWSFSRKYHLS